MNLFAGSFAGGLSTAGLGGGLLRQQQQPGGLQGAGLGGLQGVGLGGLQGPGLGGLQGVELGGLQGAGLESSKGLFGAQQGEYN